MTTITYTGGATSNFTYDALGWRLSIIEKNSSGTVTSTKQFVWVGASMAEERDASNTVTKRFYLQGEQIGSSNYYYTRDHLGSIREMTNSSGSLVSRLAYDPYGRVTVVSGTTLPDFQYAGMYEHATSGLTLTLFRAYDPNTAKWLSRDPLPDAEMKQGPNLYEYVVNDPVDQFDPFGLAGRNFNPGSPTQVINDPIGAFLSFLFGDKRPAVISNNLACAIQTTQNDNPQNFTPTSIPTNVTPGDYFSLAHFLDWLDVALTDGEYRYTNDGTTTTISDYYAFPVYNAGHSGGLSQYNNTLLSPLGIFNSGYPISGQFKNCPAK